MLIWRTFGFVVPKSGLYKAPADPLNPAATHGHADAAGRVLTTIDTRTTDEAARGGPPSCVLHEGNGGEYRKSFHVRLFPPFPPPLPLFSPLGGEVGGVRTASSSISALIPPRMQGSQPNAKALRARLPARVLNSMTWAPDGPPSMRPSPSPVMGGRSWRTDTTPSRARDRTAVAHPIRTDARAVTVL